jgi:hypothetical protein
MIFIDSMSRRGLLLKVEIATLLHLTTGILKPTSGMAYCQI